MLLFTIGAQGPKINLVYVDAGGSDEEEEEEEEEGEQDDYELTVFAQRSNLSDGEKAHHRQILPPGGVFKGVPFVTCLTSTNVDNHQMVRSSSYISFLFLCTYLVVWTIFAKLLIFLICLHLRNYRSTW